MTELRFHKATTLPVTLEPSTIYFIRNTSNGLLLIYLTNATGTIAYKTHDTSDVSSIVMAIINTLINMPGGLVGLDLSSNIIGLPNASTTVKGIVQLNDTLTSTSTTLAATANAVKTVNDSMNTQLGNIATALTSILG